MFSNIGRALDDLFYFAVISTLVAWPLALWKAYDIIVWLLSHVSVSVA